MSELLTPEEVAARLPRFTTFWVQKQCRTGRLRASKLGNKWLITPADLDEFIANGSNDLKPRKRRRRNITVA